MFQHLRLGCQTARGIVNDKNWVKMTDKQAALHFHWKLVNVFLALCYFLDCDSKVGHIPPVYWCITLMVFLSRFRCLEFSSFLYLLARGGGISQEHFYVKSLGHT